MANFLFASWPFEVTCIYLRGPDETCAILPVVFLLSCCPTNADVIDELDKSVLTLWLATALLILSICIE